jgi:putative transposase
MGIFEKLMKKMVQHYAKESALGWKWQAMDSKSCAAPLGGEKSGKNPTDRGKLGAKIHTFWSMRGGCSIERGPHWGQSPRQDGTRWPRWI